MMDYNNTFSTDVYSVTSISTPIYDDYSYTSYERFWDILNLVILIIGIVANTAFLVLLVKEKKSTSFTVYVGANVVNDTISLIDILLFDSILQLFDFDIPATHSLLCKFQGLLFFSVQILFGWLVVLMTTERLIHAYFPRMTKLFDRRKPGLIAVLLIVCGTLFINVHYVMHAELNDFPLNDGKIISICDIVDLYDGDQYREYYIIHDKFIIPIISAVLPGLCILIGNILLMKAFCQTPRTQAGTSRFKVKDRDMYVFTTMMSVMFLCIDIPVIVLFHCLTYRAADFALNILCSLNHSLKCFVYILYKRNVRLRCIGCIARRQTDGMKDIS